MSRLNSIQRENGITEGVIWKQLLIFFFPIVLGTFFQQLYNTVDAAVVGRFAGTEALAAVGGATGNLINLIVGFFVGLSSGATVILSQFYGARQTEEVSKTVHTAIALSILAGLLIMALGFALSPTLLRMMRTPEEVMGYALTYIRIYFAGMVPSLIYNIGSGLLRAVGDSRRPLYFLIAACLTNIVLDIVMVRYWHMGVAGAALATIISQAVSAALVIIVLVRSQTSYHLNIKKIRIHVPLLRSIVRIGLPAGLQSILYSTSNVIIQSSINGFGTTSMAAWTAYSRLDSFFWMIVNAFGISITTFVGQNFGARRLDRMRKSIWVCLGMACMATLMVSGLLLTFGRYLYQIFTDDQAVIKKGIEVMRLLVPCYILYVCIEIFTGALRGVGDTLIPTVMTLFGVCVMRLIWVLWITPLHNTMSFMLLSYPITWALTSGMFLLYYFFGGWLTRSLKKAQA